jgi:hypothetical protein
MALLSCAYFVGEAAAADGCRDKRCFRVVTVAGQLIAGVCAAVCTILMSMLGLCIPHHSCSMHSLSCPRLVTVCMAECGNLVLCVLNGVAAAAAVLKRKMQNVPCGVVLSFCLRCLQRPAPCLVGVASRVEAA